MTTKSIYAKQDKIADRLRSSLDQLEVARDHHLKAQRLNVCGVAQIGRSKCWLI